MRTHLLATTGVAALLRAMSAHTQTMTGGVGKRRVPRRPVVLLSPLAFASNQTLLAALTVGSFNAGLLASASAETCVTGMNQTFANAVTGVSGGPGTTVVTGVTDTPGAVPFLTSAGLNQTTGTAVTSVTSTPGTVTGITPGTNNPNLVTVAFDKSDTTHGGNTAFYGTNGNRYDVRHCY